MIFGRKRKLMCNFGLSQIQDNQFKKLIGDDISPDILIWRRTVCWGSRTLMNISDEHLNGIIGYMKKIRKTKKYEFIEIYKFVAEYKFRKKFNIHIPKYND